MINQTKKILLLLTAALALALAISAYPAPHTAVPGGLMAATGGSVAGTTIWPWFVAAGLVVVGVVLFIVLRRRSNPSSAHDADSPASDADQPAADAEPTDAPSDAGTPEADADATAPDTES
ncbi:MAG: LPXTG cell wall anchor domain-containing protein [Propionibacteriaceae bacterium]|nr:LPXTG cell wall anchor domain-containing protein [Propionibacteriaceae bacterium]